MAQKPTPLNWFFLIALGVIWGMSFTTTSLAVRDFGPMSVAALRLTLGAALLMGFVLATGRPIPSFTTRTDRLTWAAAISLGIVSNALPFSLLSWAQIHVESGIAGISMATVPLIILPLAHLLLPDDKMTPLKVLGLCFGFAGVVLLIGPAAILNPTSGGVETLARAACVFSACCYAVGSIVTRLAPEFSPISFSALGLLVAAVIMVPMALAFEGIPQAPSGLGVATILYLGVFPTALATIMLVMVIKSAGPTFLSQVNYQVPVWAVIFGTVFLAESLPTQFFISLGLILIGLAVSRAAQIRR